MYFYCTDKGNTRTHWKTFCYNMSVVKDQQLNDTYIFTLNPMLIEFINYYVTVGRLPPGDPHTFYI